MTAMELLILLAVAGVCGALGQALAGGSRGGCLLAIALGFLGAWIGRSLATALELPPIFVISVDGNGFPIVWSIVGAALCVGALSLIARRPR